MFRSQLAVRKHWIRPVVILLLAYLAIAYLVAGALFWFKQGDMLFPAPKTFGKATPANMGLRFEDVRIQVNARSFLHAWWIPSAAASERIILVFHGNGYVLEDMVPEEVTSLCKLNANLLLIDYRGYGSSTPIGPSEATVNADADAALSYLLRDRIAAMGKVFVLGRSIGSGPATYLAWKNPGLGGLILESPFSSIEDAAGGFWYLRLYPLSLLLHTHFDNLSKIGSVRVPLFIVSGTADTLTPTRMAEKLFAQAHEPKQLYLVRSGTHNDVTTIGGERLARAMRAFVEEH